MHELVPTATSIALFVNPANPIAETLSRDGQSAARILGMQLHVLRAGTESALDMAFASLAQLRVGSVVIGADAFFFRSSAQLAALAMRHAIPSISPYRPFADAGGLMSYGGGSTDAYRLTGAYAGRILKGEKPADMPVQQLVKVEFIVNLKAAKALALAIPASAARPRRRGDRMSRRQFLNAGSVSCRTRRNHASEPFACQGVFLCWIGGGDLFLDG